MPSLGTQPEPSSSIDAVEPVEKFVLPSGSTLTVCCAFTVFLMCNQYKTISLWQIWFHAIYILLLYLSLVTSTRCILCTVTGPSVVDVHGMLNSVQDRCGYTLMKTSSIPDLQVRATFQERRRTDVSFLDSVILSLDKLGVQINLEQGGRVKVSYNVLQNVDLHRFTLVSTNLAPMERIDFAGERPRKIYTSTHFPGEKSD